MKYKVIKANSFKTSPWSGGSTTELFIYPLQSKYAARDFDFRLSTATVNIEESTFTPLPGIKRTLMVLDGEMTLSHKEHHIKKLSKFDSDNFDGGWVTSSKGKCIDFNLMSMGETRGTVDSLQIVKDKEIEFSFSDNIKHSILYIYSGHIKIGNESIELGDIIVFENPIKSIKIYGVENCDLIITNIFE